MNVKDNPFFKHLTKLVPDDPLNQTQYIWMVFLGLLGYAGMTWYTVVYQFAWSTFFQAVFMTAIAMLSLAGLKQTGNAYYMMKEMMGKPKEEIKLEDTQEMLEGFDE